MPTIQIPVPIYLGTGSHCEAVQAEAEVSLTIEPSDLGRALARYSSPEQAGVILGFYEDINDMQLAYIGSEPAFDNAGRADVAAVLRTLADFIESPVPGTQQ